MLSSPEFSASLRLRVSAFTSSSFRVFQFCPQKNGCRPLRNDTRCTDRGLLAGLLPDIPLRATHAVAAVVAQVAVAVADGDRAAVVATGASVWKLANCSLRGHEYMRRRSGRRRITPRPLEPIGLRGADFRGRRLCRWLPA